MIQAIAVDLYGDGVVSFERIGGFLNAISGDVIDISNGTVYNIIKNFSKKCEPEIERIKAALLQSEVMHTDATVVSVNGRQAYIRNQSTANEVLYSAMSKKSIEELKRNTILGEFSSILIHDHETAMYNFGTGHGECNAHILRYLKKNTEESGNEWSNALSELLREMNTERKNRLAKGSWFEVAEINEYEREYDRIIKKGRKENKKTKSQYVKEEETVLLNRLEKYKANHMLFIHDNRVPFDNNMSERDLRKCKNRQKMAGGFRTEAGQKMYCKILSVIETCKRKGESVFGKITEMLLDRPIMAQ